MIIGFMGNARSGKDTCTEYLVNEYGFIRYAFGDKVKELSKCMFSFTDEQLYGDSKEKVDPRWNITPRESFQILGTDFAQFFIHDKMPHLNVPCREFWSKQFENWFNIEKKDNLNVKIVISDVRFLHEVNTIKRLGGYIIKIVRPDLIKNDYIYSHISETEQTYIPDYLINKTIYNNSSKEELYKTLKYTIN